MNDKRNADDGRYAYDGLDRVLHEKARLGIDSKPERVQLELRSQAATALVVLSQARSRLCAPALTVPLWFSQHGRLHSRHRLWSAARVSLVRRLIGMPAASAMCAIFFAPSSLSTSAVRSVNDRVGLMAVAIAARGASGA